MCILRWKYSYIRHFLQSVGGTYRALLCLLMLGSFALSLPVQAAQPKLSIVPFISTDSGTQTAYIDVSKKLTAKLKTKGAEVVAVDATGQQTQKTRLPGKADFARWKKSFAEGKELLRSKQPDKAKVALEAARTALFKSLGHVTDFYQVMELYRLLGICYFRMGMGEEGEGVIRKLGILVPRYKFSVSKMPPAMGRVLKRAQKSAAAAKHTLILTVPAGSSVQLNQAKSDNASGEVPINHLATGKHFLWVRKAGFLPYAERIDVASGTTRLTIELKPLPKAGGPDLGTEIRQIRAWLQRRSLPRSLGRAAHKIAESLDVPMVLMGYFHKSGGYNNLHMFVYRKSDQLLKLIPPEQFDNEMLELDIKLVTMSSSLKETLGKIDGLATQPWMQASTPVARQPAPTPTPVVRPAVRVAVAVSPAPRRAGSSEDDDDLDNPKDVKVGGPQIVRREPPPRVVARPTPRPAAPAPRQEEPPPRQTEPAARRRSSDDDDDFDSPSKPRRAAPAPRVAPAVRVAPVIRRVIVTPSPVTPVRVTPPTARVVPRRAAPVIREEPPAVVPQRKVIVREDPPRARRRRVAIAVRRRRQGFDPDRDVDWSNPVPKERPARTDDDRDDDPPPVRAAIVRREPVQEPIVRRDPVQEPTRPRPAPVAPPRRRVDDDDDPPPARRAVVARTAPPVRRNDEDWSSRPTLPPQQRTTPPAGGGITRKWWFWTAIGVGTAAAAGTVIGLAVIHSGPGQAFNVHIKPNPPTQ